MAASVHAAISTTLTDAIIGGGVVGTQAARMAMGLGAEVKVLDLSFARHGLDAIRSKTHLRHGINIHRSHVTNKAVGESLQLAYVDLEKVLAG